MSGEALRVRSWAGLAWLAVPFIAYVAVLRTLWFNAPIWDDYDCVLIGTMKLFDAPSFVDWIGLVVDLHNEHRIAVVRLGAWTLASVTGHIDFRLMVVFGVATVFGMAALIWAEFRKEVPAPLFAAAGFLLFQWSYFEAALMGSAALANLTVVTFSFAALFFAAREGRAAVAATLFFGMLAAGSMANGLFALPIAAAGAAAMRRRNHALLFGAVAIVLWALYLSNYARPGGHPTTLAALFAPISAARLYLLVIGSIVPGIWLPTMAGGLALMVLAWMARRRFWVEHPAVAMWVLFVLASAAAITVGRVGFGVVYASRYGLLSSALAAVLLLSICALTQPWMVRRMVTAISGSVLLCVGASVLSWPAVTSYSTNAKRLAKAISAAPEVSVQPYFGIYYPVPSQAQAILVAAERRGLYVPRIERVFPAEVRALAALPVARRGGHLDNVVVKGNRVQVGGWTDIPSIVPQRSFGIFPGEGSPRAGAVATHDRADVAMASRHPNLQFGGFYFELEYASEEVARRAAESMCVVVEAPAAGAAILVRPGLACTAH